MLRATPPMNGHRQKTPDEQVRRHRESAALPRHQHHGPEKHPDEGGHHDAFTLGWS
jgi:hypothetical protein